MVWYVLVFFLIYTLILHLEVETICGMTFSGFLILTSNVQYFTPKSLTPAQYIGTVMSECALSELGWLT